MHELSVTESILGIVVKHAERNHVEKVVTIHLKIGELTDLANEYIQHYFDYLSKGTIAEGAALNMERSPVVFQCNDCKTTIQTSLKDSGKVVCCQCGGANVALVSGREFYIKHIEVI
jgi:hydrogenase nickel incorporation protein HypA/HybF